MHLCIVLHFAHGPALARFFTCSTIIGYTIIGYKIINTNGYKINTNGVS